MTAYVNIMVAQHDNVLLAPNAALRFKPKEDESQTGKTAGANRSANGNGQHGAKKKSGQDSGSSGKVYIIKDGKPTPVGVNLGISDSRVTEITSKDLKINDQVIIGENQNTDAAPTSTSTMRFRMF
jgi:HlyD family secretion protein